MRKILILILSFVAACSIFVSCKTADNKKEGVYQDYFTNGEIAFGDVYYFDLCIVDGRPLDFEVSFGNKNVAVENYGFLADQTGEYTVKAKLSNGTIAGTFKVVSVDKNGPNVALSYYDKHVVVGTTLKLPDVTVADDKDENLTVTKVLYRDNVEVEIKDGTFTVEDSEYRYVVKATDLAGNTTEKTATIYGETEIDTHIALDWANGKATIPFAQEMHATTFGTTTEQVYPGFESSFFIDMQEGNQTSCVTFKNSLVKNLSDYDYIVCYMYNDSTKPRMMSLNWTSEYAPFLNVGGWKALVVPISEELSELSWNGYFRENHDWTSLDGMRIYVQDAENATGRVYFSNLYALNAPNKTDFEAKINEFLLATLGDDYKAMFRELSLNYEILKEQEDVTDLYALALDHYMRLDMGDDYDDGVLCALSHPFGTTQLIGAGDMWSSPESLRYTEDICYGTEKGSLEVTTKPNMRYANLSVCTTLQGGYVGSGMIEFYVKNTTGSPLELYTNDSLNYGGVYTVTESNEWQKVVLATPFNSVFDGMTICMRGASESVISNKSEKVYFSDIRIVDLADEGTYCETDDNVSVNFKSWNGSAVCSDEVKYEDKNTVKISGPAPSWGAVGVFLNTMLLRGCFADENVKEVAVSFKYYVESRNENMHYIYLGGPGGTDHSEVLGENGKWNTFSTTFNEVEANTIIALSETKNMIWTGHENEAVFYIADITYQKTYYAEGEKPYKPDKTTEFVITAATIEWQEPASCKYRSDITYNGEKYSTEISFNVGYKYADFVVNLPTTLTNFADGKIEFYIKNTTGVALEIYTDPSKWSGVVSVSASGEWQKISLYVDDSDGVDDVTVYLRGAGEAVVNESSIKSVFISMVNC